MHSFMPLFNCSFAILFALLFQSQRVMSKLGQYSQSIAGSLGKSADRGGRPHTARFRNAGELRIAMCQTSDNADNACRLEHSCIAGCFQRKEGEVLQTAMYLWQVLDNLFRFVIIFKYFGYQTAVCCGVCTLCVLHQTNQVTVAHASIDLTAACATESVCRWPTAHICNSTSRCCTYPMSGF